VRSVHWAHRFVKPDDRLDGFLHSRFIDVLVENDLDAKGGFA
jgi:hypothetical protein